MPTKQLFDDNPPVRKRRRLLQFSLRVSLVLLVLLSLMMAIWANWYRFPGTLYFDANGFPHGTGSQEYYYPSGSLKLVDRYYNGLMTQKTWFKPNGNLIAVSQFSKEKGGVGYYLNDDGSIRQRTKYEYRPSQRDFIAHGEVTIYRPDGSVQGVEQYVEGQPAIGWDAFYKKYN